jgi:hypothetical protein
MSRNDADTRSGLIIIRLWRGEDGPDVLRARLTVKLDLAADATEYAAAPTVEALAAQVRAWAEAFLADPPVTA